MRLFFYGTLRDPEVRRLVFGARHDSLSVRPARLVGFRACQAQGGAFPVLVRRTAGRVPGQLVDGLAYVDLLRLFHFEGPDYHPARHLAIDAEGCRASAWVLLPSHARVVAGGTWRLRHWQLYRKPRVLPSLRIWMREFDRVQGNSVEVNWPVRRWLAACRETGELGD